MIKSEKGKVILKGDANGVLAEFGCIYSTLVERLGKDIVNRTIALTDILEIAKGDNKHENN